MDSDSDDSVAELGLKNLPLALRLKLLAAPGAGTAAPSKAPQNLAQEKRRGSSSLLEDGDETGDSAAPTHLTPAELQRLIESACSNELEEAFNGLSKLQPVLVRAAKAVAATQSMGPSTSAPAVWRLPLSAAQIVKLWESCHAMGEKDDLAAACGIAVNLGILHPPSSFPFQERGARELAHAQAHFFGMAVRLACKVLRGPGLEKLKRVPGYESAPAFVSRSRDRDTVFACLSQLAPALPDLSPVLASTERDREARLASGGGAGEGAGHEDEASHTVLSSQAPGGGYGGPSGLSVPGCPWTAQERMHMLHRLHAHMAREEEEDSAAMPRGWLQAGLAAAKARLEAGITTTETEGKESEYERMGDGGSSPRDAGTRAGTVPTRTGGGSGVGRPGTSVGMRSALRSAHSQFGVPTPGGGASPPKAKTRAGGSAGGRDVGRGLQRPKTQAGGGTTAPKALSRTPLPHTHIACSPSACTAAIVDVPAAADALPVIPPGILSGVDVPEEGEVPFILPGPLVTQAADSGDAGRAPTPTPVPELVGSVLLAESPVANASPGSGRLEDIPPPAPLPLPGSVQRPASVSQGVRPGRAGVPRASASLSRSPTSRPQSAPLPLASTPTPKHGEHAPRRMGMGVGRASPAVRTASVTVSRAASAVRHKATPTPVTPSAGEARASVVLSGRSVRWGRTGAGADRPTASAFAEVAYSAVTPLSAQSIRRVQGLWQGSGAGGGSGGTPLARDRVGAGTERIPLVERCGSEGGLGRASGSLGLPTAVLLSQQVYTVSVGGAAGRLLVGPLASSSSSSTEWAAAQAASASSTPLLSPEASPRTHRRAHGPIFPPLPPTGDEGREAGLTGGRELPGQTGGASGGQAKEKVASST